ncbi:IS66 family transposase [Candidatus Oscillochloris fontis]|uniref:IS66 family transposase n=1 Tax=Candidatus Oscillochloris fontis TaxID=2496868 RepID=UPI0013757CB4|nr:IS66 family transposase [Candidatus Oscillochloris fontis]
MDEPQRPPELSEDAWQATPREVRQFIALLVQKLAAIEARLNQNSQNSSKPPSSDPPSAPPRPAKTPRGKPKTKGAQPGHPDQQRDLMPTSEVSQVVPLRPTTCPGCQHALPDDLAPVGSPRRQQVWDIPVAPPEVTEYQYYTVICPCCQAWVAAERPDAVPPGAFGPRMVALIALLHGRYRISNRELVDLLRMVWQIPISVGSVCDLQQVASAALIPAYTEVQAAIAEADHVHVDETSWREGSRTPWLWVAVGTLATLFMVQLGRGKTQMHALLNTTFAGYVTSDRLAAYNSLPPERRQVCWAHLIRNLRSRVETKGRWQADAADLLALADLVFAVWDRYRDGVIDRAVLRAMLAPIQHAMWERLHVAAQGGHYLSSLGRELIRLWDALWTFVEVEGIEPTNNAAERALRPAVLWRKGSYGTQSDGGSRFVERMLTVTATCQQHERPLFPYLIAAVTAYWANQPAPQLLPAGGA